MNQPASLSDQQNRIWRDVEKSRHPQRPHTIDFLQQLFVSYQEFKGDRRFADDPALLCGIGEIRQDSQFKTKTNSVFFIGHEKGRSSKEKQIHNFGSPRPEAYRKALRIFELAERFKKPVLTLIDTVGAYPGLEAEARGQAEAIASSILKMFEVKTPTVGVVIGEGGSGGALAIGVVDRLLMLEHATYSVISPESCAAILWGHSGEAKQAAVALKLGAKDVFSLGLCDGLIEEGGEGAHESLEETSLNLRRAILKEIAELEKQDLNTLTVKRFEKYRHIDAKHFS